MKFIVNIPDRPGDSPNATIQGIRQGMAWAFDRMEGVTVDHCVGVRDTHVVLDALRQVVIEAAESYEGLASSATSEERKSAYTGQADGFRCAQGFIDNALAGLP